jgi:endonuclease/exonuclease/phosphatase family metal-dependent hydrolase
MTVLRIGTYNLYEFGNATPASQSRRGDVIKVIRGRDVDVLAVQEIGGQPADHPDAKFQVLDRFAADTGLCCRLDRAPAIAVSNLRYATAVLWHPRVRPVGLVWPGEGAFQRRVAAIVLDIAGRRVAAGSYHATPARKCQRIDDAASLAMSMTQGRFDEAVLCGDLNDTSAARASDGAYLDRDWALQFDARSPTWGRAARTWLSSSRTLRPIGKPGCGAENGTWRPFHRRLTTHTVLVELTGGRRKLTGVAGFRRLPA